MSLERPKKCEAKHKQNLHNDELVATTISKNSLTEFTKEVKVVGNKRRTRGYNPKYEENQIESLIGNSKRKRLNLKEKPKSQEDKHSSA